MYQTVITRTGNNGFIEVYYVPSSQYSAIVNGSILIVPPGTVAFVAINGILSRPYSPGRYEIFTGVDPFFVRLRNILTRGNPGTTLAIYFVSINKTKFFKLGTGEIPFIEHRFKITMKALASCNLSISISNPQTVISKIVGTYSDLFNEEDISPCIEQTILSPVRDVIAKEISNLSITSFNSHLSDISESAYKLLKTRLKEYGFELEMFDVTSINIPSTEMNRLYAKEDKYADGIILTDIEADNIKRVWGNIDKRNLVDISTGTRTGGPVSTPQFTPPQGGGMNGIAPAMIQLMMLSRMMPNFNNAINEAVHQTSASEDANSDVQSNQQSSSIHPPIPSRNMHCPYCNETIARKSEVCPICGHKLK